MSESALNNKRIAKNTLLLYVRMLFIMAVNLYTSRVVLNALGVVDYGIYNVVGGIVTMFAFMKGALVTSTQRYLTFELGRGDIKQLRIVFSTSIQIHLILSIIILLLGESIGLWFLYEKMIIPEERFYAAMWVYQLSILTMIVQIMSVPYNSTIIAHERMGVFALISVVEVVLNLLIAYMLLISSIDKLILYAILYTLVQVIIRFIYSLYCSKNFEETKLVKERNKTLIREMGQFAGWNVWGNLAAMLFGTGLNMLLNVFFGPVVNAARGVAVQVESAVTQLSTNFLMAVNPQLTKLYAIGDYKNLHSLLYRSSKIACFLLFTLSLPILLETDFILTVWLKIVPEHTVHFVRILLIIVIIDAIARPLMTAAAATGKVKVYQSVIGGILLMIVPVAYVTLKLGGAPESAYIVYLSIVVIAFIARLFIVKPMIQLPLREYMLNVIVKCFLVCFLSFMVVWTVKKIMTQSTWGSIFICVISIIVVLFFSFFIGLTRNERASIKNSALKYITPKKQK